ncbi:MAG: MOSC domain-containing protein [Flavobacteriaceae bacterium]|nr:MOSC domain-containing protein [Flavobacteriaceae bacterium]
MKVVSVNTGEKTLIKWKRKTVETGIFKRPSESPIFLGKEDVVNDTVIDRRYHGGIEKAVYAYNEDHYEFWRNLYPALNWDFGMFGENLTVSGLDETAIRKGNIYRLGDAIIEVTKPREPCYKLGIRFNDQGVLRTFWNSTMSGVYFKVLQTGLVAKGDEMILLEEKIDNETIAGIYALKRIQNRQ